MGTHEVSNDATGSASVASVDMKLEVVVIPVSDVDRAKESTQGSDGGSMPIASPVTISVWFSSRLLVPAAQSNSA